MDLERPSNVDRFAGAGTCSDDTATPKQGALNLAVEHRADQPRLGRNLETVGIWRGTEISNLFPSTGESART
jgi:hypothetical protein